jgi:hypothetical protein
VPSVGFEPTISAGERPQVHALDHAATGNGTTASYILMFTCLDMRRGKTYSAVLEASTRTECSCSRLTDKKIVMLLLTECNPS